MKPSRSTTTRPIRTSTPARAIAGLPSMGSWVTYGLGATMADDLPGFIVLDFSVGKGAQSQPIAAQAMAQRIPAQPLSRRASSTPAAIRYTTSSNPRGRGRRAPAAPGRSTTVNARINSLQRCRLARSGKFFHAEQPSTIWPSACRLQRSQADGRERRDRKQTARNAYGAKAGRRLVSPANCLLARRLAERACASSSSTIAAGTITAD